MDKLTTIHNIDIYLGEAQLPKYSELVDLLREQNRLLGMVDDFGTATGGLGHPDEQNSVLDRTNPVLAFIPLGPLPTEETEWYIKLNAASLTNVYYWAEGLGWVTNHERASLFDDEADARSVAAQVQHHEKSEVLVCQKRR